MSVAAGLTSTTGLYIPEIWSGKTLVKFYKSTIFGTIANTNYKGEISGYGDTVHIRSVPTITIRDYVIGQGLTYERPKTELTDLLIDKGKYWAFSVNDVEKAQADLQYVEDWSDDASQQLGISIDTAILADVYADAAAANKGITAGAVSSAFDLGVTTDPVLVDKTNILDLIVDTGSCLDEQNVPESGRWIVFPPLICGMIKKSDLKDASLAGDGTSIMRNGRLGMIDRFTIYRSNSIATTVSGTEFNCIAGTNHAITFASQLTETETLKNPDDFGDLMRGLQVYGFKVEKPEALCHLCLKKAT
jgi:hypothetical protein